MFGRFHDRAASGRRVLDLRGVAGQASLVPPWTFDAAENRSKLVHARALASSTDACRGADKAKGR